MHDPETGVAGSELVHCALDTFARGGAVVVHHHHAARHHPRAEEVQAEPRDGIHVDVEVHQTECALPGEGHRRFANITNLQSDKRELAKIFRDLLCLDTGELDARPVHSIDTVIDLDVSLESVA